MHPLAALALSSAIEGFSKEFGSQLAKKIFGGSGGDAGAIKKALKEINEQLRNINIKLGYLTSLVERLPDVILVQYRRELADESYRLLESADAVLQAASGRGRVRPPAREFAIQLLAAWRTIVDLEDRPQRLMIIPYWTEFTRFILVENINTTLAALIEQKLAALDGHIVRSKMALDAAYTEAEALFKDGHFAAGQVIADPPFVTWTLAPKKYEEFCLSDGEMGNICGRAEVKSFTREQKRREAKLNALRNTIQVESAEIRAATPPAETLRLYHSSLLIGNAAKAVPGPEWAFPPVVELNIEEPED
jgi:hypothetical protein